MTVVCLPGASALMASPICSSGTDRLDAFLDFKPAGRAKG